MLLILNEPATLPLPATAAGTWRDLFSEQQLMFRAADELLVPGHGWRVLERVVG